MKTRSATETPAGTDHRPLGLQPRFGDSGVDAGHAAILYTAALREVAEECGVNIADVASMHPHSRWITPQPSVSPKRFDTWFFVAALPAGEVARHDQHEVVESLWLRPRDALQAYWLGSIQLAVPQLMSLAALARLVWRAGRYEPVAGFDAFFE